MLNNVIEFALILARNIILKPSDSTEFIHYFFFNFKKNVIGSFSEEKRIEKCVSSDI